jgi:TRAP-type C4-dicarboxylate transport system substrate-binding protein
MTETTKELKAELEKSLAMLRTLRDEIRVRAHLATMEVKQRWNDLEPRVQDAVEQAAKDVSETSHTAVKDLTEALKKLRASLH